MHIPSRGFVIFKVEYDKKGIARKRVFFHGLSTLALGPDDTTTQDVLKEICHKMSSFDRKEYYYYELYEDEIKIQILEGARGYPLDS